MGRKTCQRGTSKSPWFDDPTLTQSKHTDRYYDNKKQGYRRPTVEQKARRWRREACEIVDEARELDEHLTEVWEQ